MAATFVRQPAFQLLRRAIVERIAPLTIITGSGLSTAAGLPDWKELRRLVQHELDEQEFADRENGVSRSKGLFDAAHDTDDYWLFFKLAKKALTAATFREKIREFLAIGDVEVPASYIDLLKLQPKGVATLNLDRLAASAVAIAHPGKPIAQIMGTEISKKWTLINEESPFLVYLHGTVEDTATWVLDQDELETLLSDQGHSHFLTTLYLNHTVLFVGVSADDIALSAPLIRLTKSSFEARRVFWFTSRSDETSSTWAEGNQVQLIRYTAGNANEHATAIAELVNNIVGFTSLDQSRPAPDKRNFRSFARVSPPVGNPDEIAALPPEEVRKTLSTLLQAELDSSTGEELYLRFNEFVDRYDYPIQTRAFYRSSRPPNNSFFDYQLSYPPLGIGNFGTVYAARDSNDNHFAVKIMHNNILSSEEMLGGFRRGSSSMKILSEYSVEGVATFVESYEMPPTIVMEFIAGNSLQELFAQLPSFPWDTKIRMMSDIADIVDSCHKLPAFVLHRDIKPSNIMLTGVDYFDHKYEKLKVLDFDMSWHKGSSEKDVVFESRDDFAYLSPEQTDSSKISKSRSTKVDSYGLGMTCYAIFGGSHPITNMPLDAKWHEYVLRAAKTGYRGDWRSAPTRLARFIIEATHIEQTERLEFSSAKRRLNKLSNLVNTDGKSVPVDVVAEEILCRVSEGSNYRWDDISDAGEVQFAGGTLVGISVDINSGEILIKVEYNDRGARSFSSRNALIGECKEYFEDIFRRESYRRVGTILNHGHLQFVGRIKIAGSLDSAIDVASEISSGIKILQKIQ